MDYAGRQARLREKLGADGLEALYVTNLTNIRYLCGFTGTNAFLLVGTEATWFLSDGRYRTQAAQEVESSEVEIYATNDLHEEAFKKILGTPTLKEAKKVGFESEHFTVAGLDSQQPWFEGRELVATKGLVSSLRRVKEPDELALIRTAAEMTDAGLAYILEKVKPGMTERELALDLEFFMRREGAEDVSFEPIVAAAERSALPHAHPTDRLVEKGRFLLFDLGCRYLGYCSDLTRTVVVGPADEKHREIYELVLSAQQVGLDAVRPGTAGVDVDRAAREIFESAGVGDAFDHGLGHGVGLNIHEEPNLSKSSKDTLAAGEVVTVEPGIYFPELGGVRIEDLVVITERGSETLSKSGKELTEL